VQFLGVYVREAHAANGWWPQAQGQAACSITQPRTLDERLDVAQQCFRALKMTMPLAVDEMDDRVGHAYSGMPDRLYIIDRQGRVAYKGGRGPFGFRPLEMEQALAMLLLEEDNHRSAQRQGKLPVLSNDEAWKRLPGSPPDPKPLPVWARRLAGPLPLTTARMLELDALHRSGNRLDPRLRGLVRWAAADANRCDYAKAVAAADLRRAGMGEDELQTLIGDPGRLSPGEQAAITFARKMMREAHAVTDEEVKQVLQFFSEEQVVALVAFLAHASFQDRIFLAVGVQAGPSGPLPPLTVSFAKPESTRPAHGAAPAAQTATAPIRQAASAEWLGLQERVGEQRARVGRIRVPSREEMLKRLGESHRAAWQAGINWSRICYTFQPELTDAWFACVAAFRQEARMDRVFEQSIFWVVTQSLQCFY
jgi:alkylhydroperoxidase family enzyme